MSRLFVKNLPDKISQEYLKKHFSQKGNVTDVKLVFKNGEFRRFGFIGYEKEEDAQNACVFFDQTFIKQAKISVEMCREFGDGKKSLTWREKNMLRKQAEKDAANNIVNNNSKTSAESKGKNKKNVPKISEHASKLVDNYKDDLDFEEFLKSGSKGLKTEDTAKGVPTKVDDDSGVDDTDGEAGEEEENSPIKIADKKDISDLDYLKSLKVSSKPESSTDTVKKKPVLLEKHYHVAIRTKERCKVRQNGYITFTRRSIKDFLKPLKCRSLRIPQRKQFVAYVGFKTEQEMRKALKKNKSFINGARVQVVEYKESKANDDDAGMTDPPWQLSEEKLKQVEPIGESGKLFVRNLLYSVTEDDLRELFEKYGQVSDISLPICKVTRRPKGFATITYLFPEHSVSAATALNGKAFKGRIMHILPARTEEDEKADGGSFKEKKAKEQKATAGSWHNWNTLFLGSGAVIDVMAQKYNKSKQEILNAEGKQSVAVNLALGESQIVDETRRFLEDNGIALDSFTNPGVQRSNTVILVKNLPANTTAKELSELFSRHGELGRVILPPSGVSAIVEYLNPEEAKKGFQRLAYSSFHYLPLYLEWAPHRVFKSDFVPKSKMKGSSNPTKEAKPEKKSPADTSNDNKDQKVAETKKSKKGKKQTQESLRDPEPDTTIYVKDLNFETTEENLKKHFSKIGPVVSVMIARRRERSQGYGFVQYVRKAHAQEALRELQESLLDERNIQIKLSEKKLVVPINSSRMIHDIGEQKSSKIMVKNIPFEATTKEIRQLFATFGELKSVRLPLKPNNTEHRGFGFIDFLTREEAKKAFEALCHSTHLYGRRLVLEWAKDDESVDEIRQRTAEQFLTGGPPLKKKRLAETLGSNMDADD